jgi:hypothetical protein
VKRKHVFWFLGGSATAFLLYKMLTRTRIRVAAQNAFFTQPGVKGGAIVLSGAWFLGIGAPGVPDFQAFISKTQAEVEARLKAFLNGHPNVNPFMTGILLLDIEDPHPQDMHKRPPAEQDAMIQALKIRIAAARAMFPSAKLALYGTINPDARGRADDPTYLARLASLKRAGQQGLFDGLDYLAPVLYLRFGPTDRDWDTLAAYTQLGIDGSKQLRKSNGKSLSILPLTSLWIANSNSKHNGQIVLDLPVPDPMKATIRLQFAIFKAAGVADGIVWTGEDSDLILHQPNPRRLTVSQHLSS